VVGEEGENRENRVTMRASEGMTRKTGGLLRWAADYQDDVDCELLALHMDLCI
jgi:hypothetical protein